MIHKYSLYLLFILTFMIGFALNANPVMDYPKGGEAFQAGQNIIIRWHIAIEHEQEDWDLYFSPDGGESWEIIAEDLPPNTMEYSWELPEINTSHAVIRILMDNVEGIMDYDDITPGFSIEGEDSVTGIEDSSPASSGLKVKPNPFSARTNIQFHIQDYTHVQLSVFDISGSRVEILVDRALQPGNYEIRWDAEGRNNGFYYCRLLTSTSDTLFRMIRKPQ